jgi:hypothetical protein
MTLVNTQLSQTPLRVEWERTLRALERSAPPATTIDLSLYSEASVAAARSAWLRRMVDEHRSATVFSALLPQAIEAEVPLDLQGMLLKMALDELHHGVLCGRVVEALGGRAAARVPQATESIAQHPGLPPLVRFTRNCVYASCISETVSVSLTTAERDETTDPFVRSVLDQLLGDEVTHARFGWVQLGLARPALSPDGWAAVEAYVPFALDHYWKQLLAKRSSEAGVQADEIALRKALGLGSSAFYTELTRATLEEVVLPQLHTAGLEVRWTPA